MGKMTKLPFIRHGKWATELLTLVHMEVCGPMSTSAIGGFLYFITSWMIDPGLDICI